MSYYDAVDNCFKKTSGGRWLFFPYGWGWSYIIDTEQQYETLRRRLDAFITGWLILFVSALLLKWYVAAIILWVLYLPLYVVWVRHLRRGLEPSGERRSWKEYAKEQAVAQSAARMWFAVIGALAFVALGLFLLIADSRTWPIGLATIIFFGACAAVGAYMLILRHRAKAGSAR